MDINGVTYDPSIMTAMNVNGQTPLPPPPESNSDAKDEYIPSGLSFDGAIPTGTYNASGMMVGEITSSTTETTDDFMTTLSNAFRANVDSIEAKMEELGLSISDLSNQDNLELLADAMNDGAESLGLPTIDNMDEVLSNLMDYIKEQDETATTVASTESSASGADAASTNSDSSSEETTTEIVMINGVAYLETTTTTNGVETTTRTKLSDTNTVNAI
ncbi:MAG: hypothetical protein K5675_02220 [Lachnospiraceae bacterium]|nr:hypothetical protein [Lachnospiraceae bacterium]